MSPEVAIRPDIETQPLSLYHLLDPEVLAHPYPLYHRLRTEDPVHWDPFLHAWIVTRYADVVKVLHDFSADRTPTPEQLTAMGLSTLNPIAQVMVKQMLFMDAPAHTRLRALASFAFTPSKVERLRAHIQEIADCLLNGVEAQGHMDLIADFAEPLPAIVTAEMLGVPVEDHNQLKAWSADFAEMLGNFQHNPDRVPRVLRSLEQMTTYFRDAIEQPGSGRREGLVQSLATAEIQGDRLSQEEVIANSIVTMVGGQETTTNLIGNGMLSLLRNQEQLEQLRADPSLTPSAVEELLRYESPSQHTARLAPRDCELGGKQIRKREAVIAVMAAGNRDPERFPDPDRLDITRKDNRHLAFGWAAHFCFGAALARIEGQIAFETILRRFSNLALEPQPLTWRTNLGLRGLNVLPITFNQSVSKKKSSRNSTASSSSIHHRNALSETKRRLLEGYLRGEFADSPMNVAKITCRPKAETAPLSLAQEQIWRRERALASGIFPHNECFTLKPNKWLDAVVLERSFAEIIRRHEIWRTSYSIANGQPIQVVHEASNSFPLRIVDLRAASEAEREKELLKLYSEGIRQPFDLDRGPLLRVMLVTLTNTDQRILVFAHLSIVDGVSVYQILPADLASLCDAFSAGKPSPLGELPIQYADYAYCQRQWLKSDELTDQLAYWREDLAGELPVLSWPSDRSRPAVQTHRGAVRSFALKRTLRGALKQFSQREGVTLFTTLVASLSALLYCYTRQANIILGTPSLGARKRSEVQALLGHFLNPVALRINLEGDPSFSELLFRTQKAVGGAVSHDDLPLEILAQELRLNPNPTRSPFFTVAISLQPKTPEISAGWHVTSMDADSGGTIWDLYLAFIETKEGVIGRAQYSTDLFEDATITQTLEELQIVMESVARDPRQCISTLPSQLRSSAALL